MSLTREPTKRIEVFYSYAHEDERWRKRIETHLTNLKRQGLISGWHDRNIKAGQEWVQEIDRHLNNAHIILLLVSPDFMASDYCYCIEMKRALERHDAGEARVIPIIIRPCDWETAPFSKLQPLPMDRKPVTEWSNRDKAFLDIAKGIRKAVEDLSKNTEAVPQVKEFPVASSSTDETEGVGPLGTQQFHDERIDGVRGALDELHRTYKNQMLPKNAMDQLFLILSVLFDRKTFLEKMADCVDHNWGGRLRAACLTKEVLQAYQINVLQCGTAKYPLYKQLLNEVDSYCMGLMGFFKLSEPHHTLDNLEKYVYNEKEFESHLPDKLPKSEIPQEIIVRCDEHLTRISELLKQLTETKAR